MTTLNLDTSGMQLLSAYQTRHGAISQAVEAEITKASTQKGAALSASELQKALTAALPAQSAQIAEVTKACSTSRYHCDGKKGDFLTQLLKLRIEKDRAEVYAQPQTRTAGRDPLIAEFIMDKDAQVVLLFNARDVDEKGRPLLMKAICREGSNLDAVDLKYYRTKWSDPKDADIQVVAKNASFVSVQDTHETEFEFGDPVVQVSFGKKGEELSRGATTRPENQETIRFYPGMWQNVNGTNVIVPNTAASESTGPSVRTGDTLDRTPVQTFDERIKLGLNVKSSFPEGGWLETLVAHVDAKVIVEPGLMFEPGTTARVSLLGTNVGTKVGVDDAFLVGSAGAEAAISMAPYENYSLEWLLGQSVVRYSHSNESESDGNERAWSLRDLVFAAKDKVGIGAGALEPLKSVSLKGPELEKSKIKAAYSEVEGSTKAQHLCFSLGEGFVSASDGASVKGWSMVVGYLDEAGKWTQAKPRTVSGKKGSSEESFEFDLSDAPALYKANRQLEVRVFNAEGVPAQRILIPFKEISWS
ncbi:MAG: hypothetical protein HYV07_23580 [Deltaproteobacteria bacterium]|nr:hypothetical protein [Deltaproteobacteria bacterium]